MDKGIPYEEFYNEIGKALTKVNGLEATEEDKQNILKMIATIKSYDEMNAYEKGRLFENMVTALFLSTKIFKVINNKNTTSNEFDILVALNKNGKILRAAKIIPDWISDRFLVEFKNHKETIEVGLVGKFFSLMDVSKINLGLFISKNGVTGKDSSHWSDAKAFINKINLKYSESSEPKILLDIDLDDIEKAIQNDIYIIDIIQDRKIQIDADISSEIFEYITPHENEEIFNKN